MNCGLDSDFEDTFLQEIAHSSLPALARQFESPTLGQRLGGTDDQRFEIIERLGSGSMGLVFLARDTLLGRMTAIKFLRDSGPPQTEEIAIGLIEEASSLARLDHENVIRIFDVGQWNAVTFLILEYLEGESLHAALKSRRVDPPWAVRLMIQVLEGLAHAHEQGVVHRDLKPSNIFILENGRVKLLDFSLAWFMTSCGQSSAPVPVSGTPLFMAPEQWLGLAQDGRTDIWAAGMVLFELLTGYHPYTELPPTKLREMVTAPEPVPLARSFNPELPACAEQVLACSLAKEKSSRFESASDFRDALLELELVFARSRTRRKSPRIAILPQSQPKAALL